MALVAGCLLIGAGIAEASSVAAPAGRGSAATAAAVDLAAARNQWIGAQLLTGGAAQAVPLVVVVADLRQALRAGANHSATAHVISVIVKFGELPDAMLTPAEDRESAADFAAINRFFTIKKNPWTGGCVAHGPGIRAAVRDWSQEPASAHHGVLKAPIAAASAALSQAEKTDTGDRSCYPAAVADLNALGRASAAEIAATTTPSAREFGDPSAAQVVDAEIVWLDNWFGFEAGGPGGGSRLGGASRL